LARPDATTIEVARDFAYRVPMTYRAAPVASLLAGITLPADIVIETVALNGFIAQLPPNIVLNTDESKAVAWLAIESPDHSWLPNSGKKNVSAGPFYIVWTEAEVASIHSEQWPYQVAKLVSQPSPFRAGLRSPSILRCRRRTLPALAKHFSSFSASPATN
jgi:hypothetical protein